MNLHKYSEKSFKVLSLDGGGIKGLFTATILAEFEKKHGSIAEHFDLLCGTSTGGLIALALAAGKTAEEIVKFYIEWGPQIFPERNFAVRYLKEKGLLFPNSRNTDQVLRRSVASIVGQKQMQDSNSYLCIPTLSFSNASPYIFKTDHDTLSRDAEVSMLDAALATAAAPFYFPVAMADGNEGAEFVDGGLWANNPSLIGLIEAARFFVGEHKPYDKLQLLSVSTLSPTIGYPTKGKRKLRLVSAAPARIFKATLESQQRATERAVEFLVPALNFPVEYTRIPSPALSAEHSAIIDLDNAAATSLKTLKFYGETVAHDWWRKPEILAFFRERAAPPVFPKVPAHSADQGK